MNKPKHKIGSAKAKSAVVGRYKPPYPGNMSNKMRMGMKKQWRARKDIDNVGQVNA